MIIEGECIPQSEIVGCKSNISSTLGCTECNDGYYLRDRQCYTCPKECLTCTDKDTCTSCINDYILYPNGTCLHYNTVTNCKSATNNKCSKCSFWHKADEAGRLCLKHAEWWVILFIVLFIILLIAILL